MSAPPASVAPSAAPPVAPRWRIVAWDARHAARAASLAVASLVVVVVATGLTDEGGVAWNVRVGRALPVVPLCAALGSYLAVARPRTRAEQLGLAALGRSPQENALGATLGGAMVAWAVALALLVAPSIEVDGFYPSVVRAAEIRFESGEGGGSFVLPRRGVRVLADGTLAELPPTPASGEEQGIPHGGRVAAGLVTLLAGTALALLVATLREAPRRAILVSTAVALPLTVLLFHAAAAHRASAYFAALPSLALLAHASLRYRRFGWQL